MCNVVSFVDTVLSVVSCKAISYISKLLKYSLSSFHQKEFYQFYPHLHVSGYNENSSLRNLLPIPFFLNLRNNSDAKYHINFEKQLRYFFISFISSPLLQVPWHQHPILLEAQILLGNSRSKYQSNHLFLSSLFFTSYFVTTLWKTFSIGISLDGFFVCIMPVLYWIVPVTVMVRNFLY